MAYTTQALVCGELGIASSTVTASSIPSSTDISNWILEAKGEIDQYTGRVWESTSISSTVWEYYDYDGGGFIILNGKPIISVEVVQTEIMGVGGTTSSWVNLTEGRTISNNFEVYKNEGVLRFHATNTGYQPMQGSRSIRVAYTYGYSTTNYLVERLATLLVAERFLNAFINQNAGVIAGDIRVGPIGIGDPTMWNLQRYDRLKTEQSELYRKLGTLKTMAPTYVFD